MKILGWFIIGGVVLFLFIVTLPFIWWIWLLVIGFVFVMLAKEKDEEKKIQRHFEREDDKKYEKIKELVIRTQNASPSFIQRELKIGYAEVVGCLDILEAEGVILTEIDSENVIRKVLIKK